MMTILNEMAPSAPFLFIFRRNSSNFYFLKKVLDIFKKSDIIDNVRGTMVNPYNNFEWRLKNEYLCFRYGNDFP